MTDITRAEFVKRIAGAGAGYLLAEPVGTALAARSSSARRRVHRFVSRPDLEPPVISVTHAAQATAPGLLFLGPSSGPGQRGAMLINDRGEVVWFHPTKPATVMNFRAAVYRGKPVLTWWEGKSKHGLGVGEHVVLDQSYREIARFPSGNGLGVDLHELIVTPSGTALVTAYDIQTVDRSSVGSSRGPVIEGIVQELEIPSARVLFEWRSLAHVKLDETYQAPTRVLDYFHVNSIGIDFDDNLIVSARNTWAVYKIDRHSGNVIWRLGGKRSDFAMGNGTAFAWQHDARTHENGSRITLFDNASVLGVVSEAQSRGLALALDTARMRATLVKQYVHHPPQLAHALGSVQTQSNGNVLVGFGTQPYFTEYSADGRVVFDARLPHGGQNYRTLRFPWVGAPSEPPRLAASPNSADHLVYASWNGATEVTSWHLLTGANPAALHSHSTTPRAGFETALRLPPKARYATAVGLDRHGRSLGRTALLKL